MFKEEILKKLSTIYYLNTKKSIIELNIVKNIEIEANSIHISLEVSNNKDFILLAKKIQKLLKNNCFRDINIEKSTNFPQVFQKKKINFTKKSLLVTGTKGGVGTSSISIALANLIAKKYSKIGLLEVSSNPTILSLLEEGLFKQKHIHQNTLQSINKNIEIINIPKFQKSFIDKALYNKKFDYLIIDLNSSLIHSQKNIVKEYQYNSTLLITTPHSSSYKNVEKYKLYLEKTTQSFFSIVENFSYFIPEGSLQKYYIFNNQKDANCNYKVTKIPIITQSQNTNKNFFQQIEESLKPLLEEI